MSVVMDSGFPSSLIADLKPRIPSPIPLPSSGIFFPPNTSNAIPKRNKKVGWLKQSLKHRCSLTSRQKYLQLLKYRRYDRSLAAAPAREATERTLAIKSHA